MTLHYTLLGCHIDVSLQDLTEQFAFCVCSQNFNGRHFQVQYATQISSANETVSSVEKQVEMRWILDIYAINVVMRMVKS